VLAHRRGGREGTMTEQRNFAEQVTFAGRPWFAPCHPFVDAPPWYVAAPPKPLTSE
jgi:hypothetical protein